MQSGRNSKVDSAGNVKDSSEKMWEMERKYWKSLENKDLETYASFLDPNFSDWPAYEEKPIGSTNKMLDFIDKIVPNLKSFKTDLIPMEIRVFDDVFFTYSLVNSVMKFNNGETRIETFRILHIWKSKGESWKMVGGMQLIL